METPHVLYHWQEETLTIFDKFDKISQLTVAGKEHRTGVRLCEPIYIMADSLIRYAKAYKIRFSSFIASDPYSYMYFKTMLYSLLQLNAAQGGVAMERGVTTDTKDNRVVCDLISKACELAGINYDELSL